MKVNERILVFSRLMNILNLLNEEELDAAKTSLISLLATNFNSENLVKEIEEVFTENQQLKQKLQLNQTGVHFNESVTN